MEEGKHTGIFAVAVQPEKCKPDITQKPQRSRLVVNAVIGLITLVVITVTVVLAVYFGIRMTRDSYKDAWETYQIGDGQTVVQKTVVNDDETEITVANELMVIFDYKNELEVVKIKNPQTGRYYDCYVKPLNGSETDYIQDEGNMEGSQLAISQSRIQGDTVGDEYSVQYRMTFNRVPESRISRTVSEMCEGGNIYWLKRIESGYRNKRRVKRKTETSFLWGLFKRTVTTYE